MTGVVGVFGFVSSFCPKGPEIVGATEESQGVLEIDRVELTGEMPGPLGEKGRKDR